VKTTREAKMERRPARPAAVTATITAITRKQRKRRLEQLGVPTWSGRRSGGTSGRTPLTLAQYRMRALRLRNEAGRKR
jgi:hypothetical protein